MHRPRARLASLFAALLLPILPSHFVAAAEPAGAPAGAPASTPAKDPLPLELNKLEPIAGGSCRVYLVATNPDPREIDPLRIDLVVFGKDNVISRRLAIDLGPLAPHKTAVRLFDLAGQSCDQIGHMLINDVLACGPARDAATPVDSVVPRAACLDRLAPSSRAHATLTK